MRDPWTSWQLEKSGRKVSTRTITVSGEVRGYGGEGTFLMVEKQSAEDDSGWDVHLLGIAVCTEGPSPGFTKISWRVGGIN